jgi:hypothetical protein
MRHWAGAVSSYRTHSPHFDTRSHHRSSASPRHTSPSTPSLSSPTQLSPIGRSHPASRRSGSVRLLVPSTS